MVVASAGRAPAHHDGDQLSIAAHDRGDQIEAGLVDEAGLDAVDALDAPEQPVVVADGLAAEVEAACAEVLVILREMLAQCDAERRHVAGRGHLRVVRQAVGVLERGARHAELARLGGHHLRETGFAAAEELADHDGRIVGRRVTRPMMPSSTESVEPVFRPSLEGGRAAA